MNLYNKFLDDWSERWFQFILDNPDKNWIYDHLSSNLNITWEIVQSNLDKPWNFDYLSRNTMDKARNDYIRKRFQEWFRRSELKEELIAKVWHPKNWEKFKYLDPETFDEELIE